MAVDQPQSYWLATAARAPRPEFDAFGPFDVVVVGGGIVGLCAAFHLQRQGRQVVLLERHRLLDGVTGHTTAKMTALHDLRYDRIFREGGPDRAYAYADANQWAIRWLFEVVAELGIECGLEKDFACTFSIRDEDREVFEREREICRRVTLPVIDLPAADYPVRFAHTLAVGDQARFHPVQFLSTLADYLTWRGVAIYENSPVEFIEEDMTGVALEVGGRTVRADKLVVATNYPVYDSGLFIARLAPYRSYAMAAQLSEDIPDGMFISTDEAMHSWRKHGNAVIVGAGNHKAGQEPDTEGEYRRLENWGRQHFPIERVLSRWSTQDNRTPDGIPYIGRSPNKEHIFVATGFDGWGMTNGMAAGKLLSDLIGDVRSPWEELYRPSRFRLSGAGELVKENANAVSHLIGDKFMSVRAGRPDDLAAGEAGIFEVHSGRVAAYRDDDGALHLRSPLCTHIGCQVAWNQAERSWDCPCHGSRFSPDGDVLHGPAVQPLEPVELDAVFMTEEKLEPIA